MKLEDMQGWMSGEDCVVVGCGSSAEREQFLRDDRPSGLMGNYWLIACNRAVQWCDPEFVLCVENWRDKHWPMIHRETNPFCVFTRIGHSARTNQPPHPRAVKIGSRAAVQEWLAPDCGEELRLAQSPFYAAAVAAYLGFETVGLIGVDMDDENRWPETTVTYRQAQDQWGALVRVCAKHRGTRIINLNHASRLKTVPFGDWGEVRTKWHQATESQAAG